MYSTIHSRQHQHEWDTDGWEWAEQGESEDQATESSEEDPWLNGEPGDEWPETMDPDKRFKGQDAGQESHKSKKRRL